MLKTTLEAATEQAISRHQLRQEDFLKLGAQELAAWCSLQQAVAKPTFSNRSAPARMCWGADQDERPNISPDVSRI
jgi:hypothetical protein